MENDIHLGIKPLNGWQLVDGRAQATVLYTTVTMEALATEQIKATLTTTEGQELHLTINVPVPARLEDSDLLSEVCQRSRPIEILGLIDN